MIGEIAQGWIIVVIIVIPAVLASVVTVMSVRTARHFNTIVGMMREKAIIIEQKLDVIHEITNSRLHGIEEELQATKVQLAMAVDTARSISEGQALRDARDEGRGERRPQG